MRRFAAVLAVVTGVFLIGFTFAEHLVSRSADAQTVSDRYSTLVSPNGLRALSSGFALLKSAGAELGTARSRACRTRSG